MESCQWAALKSIQRFHLSGHSDRNNRVCFSIIHLNIYICKKKYMLCKQTLVLSSSGIYIKYHLKYWKQYANWVHKYSIQRDTLLVLNLLQCFQFVWLQLSSLNNWLDFSNTLTASRGCSSAEIFEQRVQHFTGNRSVQNKVPNYWPVSNHNSQN